jgi:hypothetical protein
MCTFFFILFEVNLPPIFHLFLCYCTADFYPFTPLRILKPLQGMKISWLERFHSWFGSLFDMVGKGGQVLVFTVFISLGSRPWISPSFESPGSPTYFPFSHLPFLPAIYFLSLTSLLSRLSTSLSLFSIYLQHISIYRTS